MLLTDGVILDLENTKEEIVRASLLPLSIIIVGVGNENFSAMEVLDGDNGRLTAKVMGEAKRDIVQFVAFKDYENDAMKLASNTLKEIPRQFMDYVEFAQIPLTGSHESVDYFSDKKAALMSHLESNGVDMQRLSAVLSVGVPSDDLDEISRMMKQEPYINPLK